MKFEKEELKEKRISAPFASQTRDEWHAARKVK
jgi:hypothetical protein